MQGPEKNSYKEFDNEKKFLRLENSPPPPPPTFLMIRPLLHNTKSFMLIYWADFWEKWANQSKRELCKENSWIQGLALKYSV